MTSSPIKEYLGKREHSFRPPVNIIFSPKNSDLPFLESPSPVRKEIVPDSGDGDHHVASPTSPLRPRILGASHPVIPSRKIFTASSPIGNSSGSGSYNYPNSGVASVISPRMTSSSPPISNAVEHTAAVSLIKKGNYPSLRIEPPKPYSWADIKRDEKHDLFLIHFMDGRKNVRGPGFFFLYLKLFEFFFFQLHVGPVRRVYA